MIKIEKGIPIPNNVDRSIYPFKQMKVGDSFTIPLRKKPGIYWCANRAFGANGHITTQKINARTLRVWRIK